MIRTLTFIVIIFLTCGLLAQDIATDRPDQTETSATVGQGVLQIETGFVFSTFEVEPTQGIEETTGDYATTLLRYGLLDNIELRLASAYTQYEAVSGKVSGFQPLSIGTKIDIHPEKGWRPEVAFIGHLTLPVGDGFFNPQFVAPDFRFSFSHGLSERFSLGYNIGMEWDGEHPKGSFVYTFALGRSVVGPLSVFAELFGEERDGWAHHFDFGLTILVNPDIQLDTSYGFSLNGDRFHFFNAGVSARFDTGRRAGSG